jgi:hypothetical protein
MQVGGGDGVVELPPPPEDLLPDKPPSRRERRADRRRARAAREAVEAGYGAELTSFQQFLAVVGINLGFFVLLIPGWLGLRAWERYKRGEPSSIRSYMWFGGIAGAFLLLTLLVGIVVSAISSTEPVSTEFPRTEPAVPSFSIPSFSPSPLPDVDLGDVLRASGDCGRKSGARIVVAPCSSPDATLVVNKTIATKGEIPRSLKGAKRAQAVRALGQQSCPVDTTFLVDELVQVVCWARR